MPRRYRMIQEIRHLRADTYVFMSDYGALEVYAQEIVSLLLEDRSSFRFKGQHGHFAARMERKRPGETYWYAYRKANKKQFRTCLGTITENITIHHLEAAAAAIQEEVNRQRALEKKWRLKHQLQTP